ncbi:MAG: hypothetical protein NZM11_03905 [Anaerolineales bacterium]|nr:hypothetical protein [Anaerolineales bacterium]
MSSRPSSEKASKIECSLFRIEPIVILLIGVLLLPGCLQQRVSPESPQPFSLSYLFTAETTYEKIEINRSRLIYTFFEDVDNKCTQWIGQSPCWTEADLKTKETGLSETEISDLIALLNQTGFWKLEATYGDASAGQRYYPYRLLVVLGENKKEVSYQSYPGASPMPEALKVIVDKLYELVRTKF